MSISLGLPHPHGVLYVGSALYIVRSCTLSFISITNHSLHLGIPSRLFVLLLIRIPCGLAVFVHLTAAFGYLLVIYLHASQVHLYV